MGPAGKTKFSQTASGCAWPERPRGESDGRSADQPKIPGGPANTQQPIRHDRPQAAADQGDRIRNNRNPKEPGRTESKLEKLAVQTKTGNGPEEAEKTVRPGCRIVPVCRGPYNKCGGMGRVATSRKSELPKNSDNASKAPKIGHTMLRKTARQKTARRSAKIRTSRSTPRSQTLSNTSKSSPTKKADTQKHKKSAHPDQPRGAQYPATYPKAARQKPARRSTKKRPANTLKATG